MPRRMPEDELAVIVNAVRARSGGVTAEAVEEELLALHEGSIARYQIRRGEFGAWQDAWSPRPRRL